MWENTVAIQSILKKKNYKVEFLTNKINKDNFKKNKWKKKQSCKKKGK
jgi:hypothetical protein